MPVSLKIPTYDEMSEMLGEKYYYQLKRLGRECYELFGSPVKLSAQKLHAVLWKLIVDEIQARYPEHLEFESRVFLEGIHGDDVHLELRVRIESSKRAFSVLFWWSKEESIIGELEEAPGKNYYTFYAPPKVTVTEIDFN